MKRWEEKGRTRLIENHMFSIDSHRLVSPRTGEDRDFFILKTCDWCNIVALTDDNQVVMVRQQRHGTDEVTLELPGGMIDPEDPTPGAAALRELVEETGYFADTVESTGVIAPNPAMLNNRCHSFLARNVVRRQAPSQDAGEDIEVVTVPLSEIPKKIASGEITHALVVVAFAFALGVGASLTDRERR